MLDILKDIDIDIKRCEDVIRENNYLEIVIATEELNDKYKNKIISLSKNDSDVVWHYSRKNLEIIEDHLKKYKEEIILKEKNKTICEKLSDLREYLNLEKNLNNDIIIEIIDKIEETHYNSNLTLDEKYKDIMKYLEIIKNMKREIGIFILEIIVLILK